MTSYTVWFVYQGLNKVLRDQNEHLIPNTQSCWLATALGRNTSNLAYHNFCTGKVLE